MSITLETLLETFQTGSGFWNPVVWIVVVIVAFLIAYVLRGFGNKEYKKIEHISCYHHAKHTSSH